MPVLCLGRNSDNRARTHLLRLLAFLDIPATTGYADEHLHRLMVDVPVVTAARLKGYVHWATVLCIERCQIAITDEILGVGCIQLALRPYVKINFLYHVLCFNIRTHS